MAIETDKQRGDPISAAEHNAIARAARAVQNIEGGKGVTPLLSPMGMSMALSPLNKFAMPAIQCWMDNVGNEPIEPFRPAGIIDQVYNADADPDSSRISRFVYTVKSPDEAESDSSFTFYGHQWVVAAERIAPGTIGRGWIKGVVPVYLRILDTTSIPEYAALEWKQNQLTAAYGGPAKVIWNSGRSGEIALVDLGNRSPDVPIPIRHTSTTAAPFAGIVQANGAESDGTLRVMRPTGADEENVMLVANFPIEAEGYGYGWESEAHHCLYTGSPSVDDRLGSQAGSYVGAISGDGTFMVRAVLGGTALAFFTKAAVAPPATIEHYNFSYIRDDNPNTTYGFPGTMRVHWHDGTGMWFAKGFSLIDPTYAPLSGTYSMLSLNMIERDGLATFIYDNFNEWLSMKFEVYEIKDAAFDPSTVTWNNHGLLTTNKIADMQWNAARRISLSAIPSPDFPWVIGSDPNGFARFTFTGAYGLMFQWVYSSGTQSPGAVVENTFHSNQPDRYNRILST